MNADDILTAARERLAEIDVQIAALTAERARLLRMTERETTPIKVPDAFRMPPPEYKIDCCPWPHHPDAKVVVMPPPCAPYSGTTALTVT